MTKGVEITHKNPKALKKLEEALKSANFKNFKVGFLKGDAYPNGTSVALVATTHEFGDKRKHIPERSYFRPTVNQFFPVIIDKIANDFKMDPLNFNGTTSLSQSAEFLRGRIRKAIVELREPANDPMTIKRKGSSNPLVDTRRMTRSVKWELEK